MRIIRPTSRLSTSPIALVCNLVECRALLMQSVIREVFGKFRGSVLGVFWAWLAPILMLSVYTFVFTIIFHASWPGLDDNPRLFPAIFFIGLMLHMVLADTLSRGPLLIIQQSNFVKKIVFPLEILPAVQLIGAFFQLLIHFAILTIYMLAVKQAPDGLFWLPLIWLPCALLLLGVSYCLAATGVFLRDLAQLSGFLASMLLFLSPVFYPLSRLPEAWQPLLYLNPITLPIEETRKALLLGMAPDFSALGIYSLVAFAILWTGYAWFQRLRPEFADAL